MNRENQLDKFKRELIKELNDRGLSLDMSEEENSIIKINSARIMSSDLNLNNMFKKYVLEKNKYMFIQTLCDNISESFNEILNKYIETEEFENFDSIKNSIMPVIKHKNYSKIKDVVFTNYNEELQVLYAIDTENSIIFIKESDLKNWKVTKKQVHNISIDNLNKMPSMIKETSNEVFSCINNDGYASSRLLLTEIPTYFSEKVKKDLFLAIPTRDDFILFSKNQITEVRKFILRKYNTSSYPLTASILSLNEEEQKWHSVE